MASSWQHITNVEGDDLGHYLDQGTPPTLYLPSPGQEGAPSDGVYLLSGHHVLGRSQTLIVGAGARIAAAAGGAELVVEGALVASVDQHLFEVGSAEARLSVRCLLGSVAAVSPRWWGAGAEVGVPDADAIEEMMGSIARDGVDTVVFPSTTSYRLHRTVTLLPGKRYLGDQSIIEATSHRVNPLLALVSTSLLRTELTGFHLRGGGHHLTLLRLVRQRSDLDGSLVPEPEPGLWLQPVPSVSATPDATVDFGRIKPIVSGESPSTAAPRRRLQPMNTWTLVTPVRVLHLSRCGFSDATRAIQTAGSFDAYLSDLAITRCDRGLDLDVDDGQVVVERVGVRRGAGTKTTEVRLRVASGSLRLDAVRVEGRTSAEVDTGTLQLRGCQLGFVSIAPWRSNPTAPERSAGRVALLECAFDGESELVAQHGRLLRVCVHVRSPHDVLVRDSRFLHADSQVGKVGLAIDWGGQGAATMVVEGCVWDGRMTSNLAQDSVAVYNTDLGASSDMELSTNRLTVRACSFTPPWHFALALEGGNVTFEDCSVETHSAMWVRQRSGAGRQVLTVRGLTFQPYEVPSVPSLYLRMQQSPSSPLSLILSHDNVVLDSDANGIELDGRVQHTGVDDAETMQLIVAVGHRLIEGATSIPLAGFVGDLYRLYPPARPVGALTASVNPQADRLCIRSGLLDGAQWKPYCRTALEMS